MHGYVYRMRGNVRERKFSRISRMTSHSRTFISRTFPISAHLIHVYCYTSASYLTTYRVSGEDMSKTIEQFFKPVCCDGSSSSKEAPAAAVLAAQKEMEKMHHGHSKGILSATRFPAANQRFSLRCSPDLLIHMVSAHATRKTERCCHLFARSTM